MPFQLFLLEERHNIHVKTQTYKSKTCGRIQIYMSLKKKEDGGMITDLVLGEFEIHALALCINNTPDLSGTQRIQVEGGPQSGQSNMLQSILQDRIYKCISLHCS